MNLKDIVSVSGLSGLYKMAGNRSNGLIIEDLDTGKRKFAPARQHQFTPLESIAIFTTTEEDSIELGKVFDKMQAGAEAHPLVDANASSDELRAYFTAVFPEHDEDRVKIGDIKKVVKWFSFLKERDLLKMEEEKTEEGSEEKGEE
ncbi:MAG: DUF5606 domain-containing protein [Saprospiraceae bacterium]